jgi:osmotically-inducible protein OsmY
MHAILLPKHRITRLFNARRHPDQAAIAARIPVIGERVPLRGYWRRQSVDPRRVWSHSMAALKRTAPQARERTSSAFQAAGERWPAIRERATSTGAAATRNMSARLPAVRRSARRVAASASAGAAHASRTVITRAPRSRLTIAAAAFSLGALIMYFLDASSGRRRRALMRDRLAHVRRILTRDVSRAARKRGRFMKGVARGVRHEAAEMLPHRHAHVDDDTLVARVRSEVLRRADVHAGDIHVDVYEGCVTLRGQLATPEEIRRVIEETRAVEGVVDVRSYLHLPGTLPPNKAEAFENGHVPAHLTR